MSEDAAFLELLAKAADLCLKPHRHACLLYTSDAADD